jgi:hypothetical protein
MTCMKYGLDGLYIWRRLLLNGKLEFRNDEEEVLKYSD